MPYEETDHIGDRFTPVGNNPRGDLTHFDTLGKFVMRYDAEENPTLQQLIPYVVILDRSGQSYFISKRIAGDHRLKGKLSLGFGGHISPEDTGQGSVILSAMEREMKEEVELVSADVPAFIGHVRDLKNSTSDHLGFVFTVRADSVRIREEKVLEGHWMSLENLIDHYYSFENWGRYIIDYFYERDKRHE